MKNFDKEKCDNVKSCKHCDFKFDENYDNRCSNFDHVIFRHIGFLELFFSPD